MSGPYLFCFLLKTESWVKNLPQIHSTPWFKPILLNWVLLKSREIQRFYSNFKRLFFSFKFTTIPFYKIKLLLKFAPRFGYVHWFMPNEAFTQFWVKVWVRPRKSAQLNNGDVRLLWVFCPIVKFERKLSSWSLFSR